jgi:osmoprotectant transport system substrate-binding protein
VYKQALETRGYTVVLRPEVRSVRSAQDALVNRRFDVYVAYTGQIVENVFGQRQPRSAKGAYEVAQALEQTRGVALLDPARYLATQKIAVTKATAARYRVTSIAQLRRVPNLTLGGSPEFQASPSGPDALRRTYRLPRLRYVPLATGAEGALSSGRVTAIVLGPAMNPRAAGLVVLRDPRRHFPPQSVVPAVLSDHSSRLGPRLGSTLDAVSARLTAQSTRTLSNAIAAGRRSPAKIVKTFLVRTDVITAANVFVASNGNDGAVNCRRFAKRVTNPDRTGATLCRTLDRAYRLAAPGETVGVEPGEYGPQAISVKRGARRPAVVVKGADGGPVVVQDLHTFGSWVTLRNITVATGANHGRGWKTNGSNVTLDNVDITGPWANVAIGGGANVTWKNSSLGDPGNIQRRLCQQGDGEPVEISNVTNLVFSNLDFYPFQPELGNPICGPDGNMHLETIRVWDGVKGWRMERSRFHAGDGSGSARVFFSKLGGSDPSDVTFVNNWFGPSSGSVSIYLTANSACNNFVFAYNHWTQALVDDCRPRNGLTMIGNTAMKPSYIPCEGITYIRNLWAWDAAGRCGSDRWVTDPCRCIAPFRYSADGYHLRRDSPAINAGEAAQCRRITRGVDIDGRPRKGVCDAGPDEYGN